MDSILRVLPGCRMGRRLRPQSCSSNEFLRLKIASAVRSLRSVSQSRASCSTDPSASAPGAGRRTEAVFVGLLLREMLPLAEREVYTAKHGYAAELAGPGIRSTANFAVVERRLPHWSQAGAITFITWRTWDSIPAPVLQEWLAERDAWLQRHGISSHLAPRDGASRGARRLHWCDQLHALDPALVQEFQRHFSDRWNENLDECYGDCVLRRPDLAQSVADSLLHFDGHATI